jgi:hypothetical protein
MDDVSGDGHSCGDSRMDETKLVDDGRCSFSKWLLLEWTNL